MKLPKAQKSQIITSFRKNEQDTGSAEVQVALLTTKVQQLTEHFKSHPGDFSSRRGLLRFVNRRRRFLQYLEKKNEDVYKDMLVRLNQQGKSKN
jgi:small subunit ribosomal protein S15